jgi:very-short-patch-repair endonuclease
VGQDKIFFRHRDGFRRLIRLTHMRRDTTTFARSLRVADNAAERALWSALKARKLEGYKFTRQFPVGPYFADFACRAQMLVIELDGSQHQDAVAYDDARDQYFLDSGYSVLRLVSGSALRNLSGLCDTILAVLENRIDGAINAPDMMFRRSDKPAVRRGFTSRNALRRSRLDPPHPCPSPKIGEG